MGNEESGREGAERETGGNEVNRIPNLYPAMPLSFSPAQTSYPIKVQDNRFPGLPSYRGTC